MLEQVGERWATLLGLFLPALVARERDRGLVDFHFVIVDLCCVLALLNEKRKGLKEGARTYRLRPSMTQ